MLKLVHVSINAASRTNTGVVSVRHGYNRYLHISKNSLKDQQFWHSSYVITLIWTAKTTIPKQDNYLCLKCFLRISVSTILFEANIV